MQCCGVVSPHPLTRYSLLCAKLSSFVHVHDKLLFSYYRQMTRTGHFPFCVKMCESFHENFKYNAVVNGDFV